MMKKIMAATTAAMLCTAAGACAFADDTDGHEGRRHSGAGPRMHHDEFGDPAQMLEMMTRHLDLDDAQAQTIGNILESAKPEIDALREQAGTARKAMHDLDVNDPDYSTKLNNLSVEIGTLTSEAMLLHGRLRAEVFAQLTPEQQALAAEGRKHIRERPRHRGFRRWHGEDSESPDTE